jgi:PST family polysaccharide transporter
MANSSAPSLTQKTVSGTLWSSLSTAGKQVLSIASVATVARILGPGAYGIMGMAALLTTFLLYFRDMGTGLAIVQRPTISDRLLSSLFWVNFGLGIALGLFLVVASPFAAKFFRTPELVPILCFLAISTWLTSSGVVHLSLLMRNMSFKTLAIVELGSGLVSYAVALSCAYSGLGVWSLVYANVAGTLFTTAGYWLGWRWRPSFEFDSAEVRSVAGFSLNFSGFGLVNYFARNADNIVVGRFLGQGPLGNYAMAYNLMLTPLQNVSSVIGQVALPAFSRIQDDNERFRSAYTRSCMLIGLITFPIMAGMGVVADPMIRAILGHKWVGAIALFQILAPVGLAQSVQTTVGQIYVAKGRTDWMFRMGFAFCAALIPTFLIGVRFGTTGVALAYCIVYLAILMVPSFMVPFKLIDLRFSAFARALLPQLAITLGMAAACFFWLRLLDSVSVSNAWMRLLTTVVLGIAVYVFELFAFWPAVMDEASTILSGSRLAFIGGWLTSMRRVRLHTA